jgi:hypothetical protein
MVSEEIKTPQITVDLRNKSIAVGTPAYGDSFSTEYVRSVLETQSELIRHGMSVAFITARDALVTRARNAVAAVFMDMEPKMDYLWFMDADMGWSPDAPLRMVASGHDVVGIPGKRKIEGANSYCVNVEAPSALIDQFGMITVNDIGTGCMLISRAALEKIIEAFPEKYYDSSLKRTVYNIFETHIDDNEFFWSEDYTFCRKWRAIGGQVWCDSSQVLTHVGNKIWAGKFKDYIEGVEK